MTLRTTVSFLRTSFDDIILHNHVQGKKSDADQPAGDTGMGASTADTEAVDLKTGIQPIAITTVGKGLADTVSGVYLMSRQ